MTHDKRKSPATHRANRNIIFSEKTNKYSRSKQPDFNAINANALSVLSLLLPRWLPDGKICGNEFVARNPKRADQTLGSFKINLHNGRWADFATGDRGSDIISLAAFLSDLSQSKAALELAQMLSMGV